MKSSAPTAAVHPSSVYVDSRPRSQLRCVPRSTSVADAEALRVMDHRAHARAQAAPVAGGTRIAETVRRGAGAGLVRWVRWDLSSLGVKVVTGAMCGYAFTNTMLATEHHDRRSRQRQPRLTRTSASATSPRARAR